MTIFDYVAFGAMAIVFIAAIVLVIWLGDLPGEIAKQRNHPQVPAIRAMGWFGLLFTGGIVWILAIVWAYFDPAAARRGGSTAELEAELARLRERIDALESQAGRAKGETP